MTTSTNDDYDVIIIGSGPGGEGAAMKAVKSGLRVAVVDDRSVVGGNCTHLGTIPSKAMRHAVQMSLDVPGRGDFSDLLEKARKVISSQSGLRLGFYQRNDVDLHVGRAAFSGATEIEVTRHDGTCYSLHSRFFVIATGARPYHPPDVDFSHPRILDSDSILLLDKTPKSISVYGAGVVGCEYSSILRGVKAKVNLINTRGQLLSYLDDEIIDALAYHLREQGVLIRHTEEYQSVEADDEGVTIFLKSGKQLRTEYLLWAQGRTGNSRDMGLEALGIEPDVRGNIPINDDYQTVQPHIYAVGDVVGFPSLASAAYDQGRFAATHLVTGSCEHSLVEDIPTGIYTIPEISSVGMTEKELTEKKVPYEVGHAFFKHLARAQITGRTTGMLKLLFHRESLEILGIHCFGYQASEIIHIGQAIMRQKNGGNTLNYFINTTFNYPTMAEAYRVAALNGINRVH